MRASTQQKREDRINHVRRIVGNEVGKEAFSHGDEDRPRRHSEPLQPSTTHPDGPTLHQQLLVDLYERPIGDPEPLSFH